MLALSDFRRIKIDLEKELTKGEEKQLRYNSNIAMAYAYGAIANAESGHPGCCGSTGDLNIYLSSLEQDKRLVNSMGHSAPIVYARHILNECEDGSYTIKNLVNDLRRCDGLPGHIERGVCGSEIIAGILGKGVGWGYGLSIGDLRRGLKKRTYTIVGDGDFQVPEVYGTLKIISNWFADGIKPNYTIIMDFNEEQLSGKCSEISPTDTSEYYEKLLGILEIPFKEINGHDFQDIHSGVRWAQKTLVNFILAHTKMCGGSCLEGKNDLHGNPGVLKNLKDIFGSLNVDHEEYARMAVPRKKEIQPESKYFGEWIHPRNALPEVVQRRFSEGQLINLFDCDVGVSTKTNVVSTDFGKGHFQAGIREGSATTIAGALSLTEKVVLGMYSAVLSTEAKSQLRMNCMNNANVTYIATHCGKAGVGPDGPTHQHPGMVGELRNMPNLEIIFPSDKIEAANAIEYALDEKGSKVIAITRNSVPVILDKSGEPFFKNRKFKYGDVHKIIDGGDGTLFTSGEMAYRSIKVVEKLKEKGYELSCVLVPCPTVEIDVDKFQTPFYSYTDDDGSGLTKTLCSICADKGIKFPNKNRFHFPENDWGQSDTTENMLRYYNRDIDSVTKLMLKDLG